MDRISKPAALSRMSYKKYQYGHKVKQMLAVFIRLLSAGYLF